MEITVFTSQNCGFCNQQKEWMVKNNIPYQEKDILNNQDARLEFVELGGQGTPLTVIKKEDSEVHVLGFNQEKLKNQLGLMK